MEEHKQRGVVHHDSGYFPGLSNRAAWIVLGVLGILLAGLVALIFLR